MTLEIAPGKTRIGWIGTGVMGSSMCGHLIAAGYPATVFNRTPEKTRPLVGQLLHDRPRDFRSDSGHAFQVGEVGEESRRDGRRVLGLAVACDQGVCHGRARVVLEMAGAFAVRPSRSRYNVAANAWKL